MLARELEKSINEINETKKMMLETNNEILAVNIQLKENDLALIEAELASEQDEEKIAELEARKVELLQEIEDMKVEAEKENQELEEIGKDLAVVKESKYSHVYDLLDDIDKEIQKYSIKISTEGATSLTDEEKNKMDKYMAMKITDDICGCRRCTSARTPRCRGAVPPDSGACPARGTGRPR